MNDDIEFKLFIELWGKLDDDELNRIFKSLDTDTLQNFIFAHEGGVLPDMNILPKLWIDRGDDPLTEVAKALGPDLARVLNAIEVTDPEYPDPEDLEGTPHGKVMKVLKLSVVNVLKFLRSLDESTCRAILIAESEYTLSRVGVAIGPVAIQEALNDPDLKAYGMQEICTKIVNECLRGGISKDSKVLKRSGKMLLVGIILTALSLDGENDDEV